MRPFVNDPEFSAGNPLVSKVMADKHCSAASLDVSTITDPFTGEVSACSISVPAGIRGTLRVDGIFGISDVDPRWREYDTPEDAFCEALSARIMQAFARVLGLGANMAGSYAYSPAQLRDPEFTRKYGITASVTDGVLFNTLARPGDKERGVATVVTQPGEYDYMAIEWIYSHPDAVSDRAFADSLIASKAGAPAFLYIPYTTNSPDPRCFRGDLGNDPFEEYDNAMRRLRFIAANATSWYEETAPQNTIFRTFLLEYILNHHISEHAKLARMVGGLYLQELSSGAKFVAVDKEVQKKALVTSIDGMARTDYMDSNKELRAFSGAYNGFAALMRINALNQPKIFARLNWSAAATRLGVTSYCIDELLSDITDEVTRNIRKGYVPDGEDYLVGVWIAMGLQKNIPVYDRNLKEYIHKAEALYAPLPLSEKLYAPVLEQACMVELDRLEGILKKGANAARSQYDKDRIGFLLSQIKGMKNSQP